MFPKEKSNICKGLAICMMLMHHLFSDYDFNGYEISFYPFSEDKVVFMAVLCKICVAVFVFISGYGLYMSYGRVEDYNTFVKKRYIGLMKTYWFLFLLVLLCQPLGRSVTDVYGSSVKDILFYGIVDFSGLAYLFGTPTLNPTWWYMSVAIILILVFPMVSYCMKRLNSYTVVFGSILLVYFLGISNASTFYVPSFLLGILCAECRYFDHLQKIFEKHKILTVFVAGMSFFVLLWYRTDYNLNGIVDGLMAVCISSLVSTFVYRIPVISRVLSCLGEHSYIMFLVHTLIYNYYFKAFIYGFKYWWLILVVLAVCSYVVAVAAEWCMRRLEKRRLWL